MAEFLLELFSEEIPARMQARAAEDLQRLVTEKLKVAGLTFTTAKSFVTPRRLALVVDGLPLAQPDVKEEKKGPRVGSPQQAVDGFLKSAGLTSLDQCEKRDTGKGEFYFAVVEKKGVATATILSQIVGQVIHEFAWPKSMRWAHGGFRWVRPLREILALFDGKVLAASRETSWRPPQPVKSVNGDEELVTAIDPFSDGTFGHRFMSPVPFRVANFADYQAKLKAARVILDQAERKASIKAQAEAAAAKEGLTVNQDEGLLEEVTGLVEWPTVLMGKIDDEFMSVPHEVLTTSMRVNQKYFALLDKDGKLAPRFLVTANIEANDGGKAIVHGNERVLRARLSDAKFFWDQDLKVSLAARVPLLDSITYHAKLGSVGEKVRRAGDLARHLADALYPGVANQREFSEAVFDATRLCKADLVSGMVSEFPELQGVMGRYYARHEKLPDAVADAIADHYKPLGPSDSCPTAPVSIIAALADKIDTLMGFFTINEKPTGSKDPYALRRAALGIIRLILENKLRLSLVEVLSVAKEGILASIKEGLGGGTSFIGQSFREMNGRPEPVDTDVASVLEFLADRLKVALKDSGIRHDYISAVFALGDDDLFRIVERAKALQGFLESDDGKNLLVLSRRAANIVRDEQKKDGKIYEPQVFAEYLTTKEDQDLLSAIDKARLGCALARQGEDYVVVMQSLATLRAPVDAFFNNVKVNDDDENVRVNRLRMLSAIDQTLRDVADFSKIEG